MGYQIGDYYIRSGKEYLEYPRHRYGIHVRVDLMENFQDLCNRLDKPYSKVMDCVFLEMENNQEFLQAVLTRLKKY